MPLYSKLTNGVRQLLQGTWYILFDFIYVHEGQKPLCISRNYKLHYAYTVKAIFRGKNLKELLQREVAR